MAKTLPSAVAEALANTDRTRIELAGIGCFANVYKAADMGLVVKHTFDHPTVGNLEPTERRIYERLGEHPFILRYFGEYQGGGNGLPSGLVFQYHGAGTLVDNLALSNYPKKRTEWPLQAAEALRHIHSKNVIHSDIGSHNFLIQEDGSLALADFGGSVIDDAQAVVSYSTRYSRPVHFTDDSDSTEVDDIFALGTVIYEIGIGHRLFPDQSSREIRKLIHARSFPDLDCVRTIPPTVRAVIRKCWACEYSNAEEVINDLKKKNPLPSPYVVYSGGLILGMAMILLVMAKKRK